MHIKEYKPKRLVLLVDVVISHVAADMFWNLNYTKKFLTPELLAKLQPYRETFVEAFDPECHGFLLPDGSWRVELRIPPEATDPMDEEEVREFCTINRYIEEFEEVLDLCVKAYDAFYTQDSEGGKP